MVISWRTYAGKSPALLKTVSRKLRTVLGNFLLLSLSLTKTSRVVCSTRLIVTARRSYTAENSRQKSFENRFRTTRQYSSYASCNSCNLCVPLLLQTALRRSLQTSTWWLAHSAVGRCNSECIGSNNGTSLLGGGFCGEFGADGGEFPRRVNGAHDPPLDK